MLTPQDIRPGDVLLCRARPSLKPTALVGAAVAAVTQSPYTHAAIALTSTEIADARPLCGVTIRPLSELVNKAMHVAVLRHPDAWDAVRVTGLREYTAALHALGAGYNYLDALLYTANKRAHAIGMVDTLQHYFDNGEPTPETDFGPFFCSELVAACFVDSGFIHPSAAIVVNPGRHSPGDLAKEPTFGCLVGFLALDPDAEVPSDDPMLLLPRYSEIFG